MSVTIQCPGPQRPLDGRGASSLPLRRSCPGVFSSEELALRGRGSKAGQAHSGDPEAMTGSVLGTSLEVHPACLLPGLLTSPTAACSVALRGNSISPTASPTFSLPPCLHPGGLPLLPASSSRFPDSRPVHSPPALCLCLELQPCIPTSLQRCPIAT